jgi:hypothetical protein
MWELGQCFTQFDEGQFGTLSLKLILNLQRNIIECVLITLFACVLL